MEIFLLLLFAFLSSPRSICAVASYVFLLYFLCGQGLFMTQIREGVLLYSVGLGQLEGKLRWEGCQGVSTAAVLR